MMRAQMRKILMSLAAVGFIAASGAAAQDFRRAQATRAELEAAVKTLEQAATSPGYSKTYRQARKTELATVKARLEDGDFQPGDEILINVVGETTLSNKFAVQPDRTLALPGLSPISVKGVLRSEVADHLTKEIGRFVKDPQVTVQGSFIRVSILGAVGKPGFYPVPADGLLTDVLMNSAGGPTQNVKMKKSSIRRDGREILDGEEVEKAVQQNKSLDQLNLHSGDEIVIGGSSGQPSGSSIRNWLWPVQIALSLTVLATRIF